MAGTRNAGTTSGARRRPARELKVGGRGKASNESPLAPGAAAARGGVKPPPGLAAPLSAASAEMSPEAFSETLRGRPLPFSLESDGGRLERFETALLSCIEGLYRDRLVSTLGEVQRRMRDCGWSLGSELAAVLTVSARRPQHFKLVPPSIGEPPRVLLRELPPWFTGFQDSDVAGDKYSPDVWEGLEHMLMEPGCFPIKGGLAEVATQLSRRGSLPVSLRRLPLGELRHVLCLALGPRQLLRYSPDDGRLLVAALERPSNRAALETTPEVLPRKAHVKHVDVSHSGFGGNAALVGAESEAARLSSSLAAAPLPPAFAAKSERERMQLMQSLRTCVHDLYRERLEPTLHEVQQRLRLHGWSHAEVQEAPMLCVREPETYELVPPTGGKEALIQLRTPPVGFRGFFPAPGDEAAGGIRPQLPVEAWQALSSYLCGPTPVLKGGVDGAAMALRESPLPQLQQLSLGELRDLVRRAAAEQGPLLVYAGNDLHQSHTAKLLGERSEVDGRIYSQI